MPQVNDDVELDQVPDRCGYAFTPGWAFESTPATEKEPAQWTSIGPRARVLTLGLTYADIESAELIPQLESMLPAVREAWSVPETALVLAAYRFDV